MSGRAGRTGFDSRGDAIMVCGQEQVEYVQELARPFNYAEGTLTSALTGERLLRTILEVIACEILSSLPDLLLFLSCTLKYTLCSRTTCPQCSPSHHHLNFNNILFKNYAGKELEKGEAEEIEAVYRRFEEEIKRFRIEDFREDAF